MKRFIVLGLFAALIMVVVSPSAVAQVENDLSPNPEPVEEQLSDSSIRSVREIFNLATDSEAIRQADDQSSEEGDAYLGVPLTASEARHVESILDTESKLGEYHDEIESGLSDAFAGVWVDRSTGGVEVLVAGERDASQVVKQYLPDKEVTVRQVSRSYDELRAVSGQITTDYGGAGGDKMRDLGIVSVGRMPSENKVVVGIDGDVEKARTELEARYGDAVMIDERDITPVSRSAGAPWKAGKQIRWSGSDPHPYYHCTGSYGIKKGSQRYVVTAAHCNNASNFTMPTPWNVAGTVLGSMTVADASTDSALIAVSSTWESTNCVYISSDLCSPMHIYRDARVGNSVCYSGATSEFGCSTVAIEQDFVVDDRKYDMILFDSLEAYNSTGVCQGDSGAPVFSSLGLWGYDVGHWGRGSISYTSDECGPGYWGFSPWSNIQRQHDFVGGCAGNWADNVGCTSPAPAFTDISANHPDYVGIKWAKDNGYLDNSGSTFAPKNSIHRWRAIQWMWRAAGSPTGYSNPGYTDVSPAASYKDAAWWAYHEGIDVGSCSGGSPCFLPALHMTRGQWAKALHEAADAPYATISPVPVPEVPPCDLTSSSTYYRAAMWNMAERLVKAIPANFGCPGGPQITQRYNASTSTTRAVIATTLYELDRYCTIEAPGTCRF
jgi:hypothetical protein